MNPLFTSFTIGNLELPNRLVMAPLTRGRAGAESIPNDMMAEYYRQRTTAGLIISEATHISPQGRGWVGAPGIHDAGQVRGWRKVTAAVHAEGGRMFAYGVPFLANPDLVARYRTGAPLNAPDFATFYAAGPEGYIDYPALAEAQPAGR